MSVFTVRFVAATSMAPFAATAPMAPVRAFRFRFDAVIVRPALLPSVIDPALRVAVLAPKLTAAPIVIAAVLAAASPITIDPAPVTPPARLVISAAVRSNADAPASDMAVPAENGLRVSTPVV